MQLFVGPWVELMRGFDSGWTLAQAREHLLGDGLFNLYYIRATSDQPPPSRQLLTFSFSSRPSEVGGAVMSLITVAAALFLIWIFARRGRRLENLGIRINQSRLSSVSTQLAVAGLVLLAIAAILHTITWLGGPLRIAASAVIADPYGAEEVYTISAMAILAVSIILRLLSVRRQGAIRAEPNTP
jgi:lysylphosphatidylglycerol synthetase-like protein (DUF2156 family)